MWGKKSKNRFPIFDFRRLTHLSIQVAVVAVLTGRRGNGKSRAEDDMKHRSMFKHLTLTMLFNFLSSARKEQIGLSLN